MHTVNYRTEVEETIVKTSRFKNFIKRQKTDIHNFWHDGDLVPPFKRLVFTISFIVSIFLGLVVFLIPGYFIVVWMAIYMHVALSFAITLMIYIVFVIAFFRALHTYVEYEKAYDERKAKDALIAKNNSSVNK